MQECTPLESLGPNSNVAPKTQLGHNIVIYHGTMTMPKHVPYIVSLGFFILRLALSLQSMHLQDGLHNVNMFQALALQTGRETVDQLSPFCTKRIIQQ